MAISEPEKKAFNARKVTIRGQEYYKEEDENSYIVPGDMRLSDFYNLTNFDIEDSVMCTIGGVAFRLFDRLPAEGDKICSEGYEFVAKEVKGLRISKVLVRKLYRNPALRSPANAISYALIHFNRNTLTRSTST